MSSAKEYGGWFPVSHHKSAKVKARHNTLKALTEIGLLEHCKDTKYGASMCQIVGNADIYRFKMPKGD